MADDYSKQQWLQGNAGQTPMSPSRFQHIEDGLAEASATANDAADAVASLQTALVSGSVAGYTWGTTFPTPSLGSPPFFYLTDHKLYMPGGDAWYGPDGTAVAGTVSGGANAPTNFTAVVNSDNTVSCAWSLPAPPSGYSISAVTVRERFKSPDGVSGMPLAGTATSNVRPTSSVASTREYYVTCTFSKAANPDVESAESNHVTVYLPYGSAPAPGGGVTPPSGGGATGTPGEILGIGTTNYFSVDVGIAGGSNVSHTMQEIRDGFTQDGYFYPNTAGDAVCMQTYANAGLTKTSPHPRTELRETKSDGTKAAWPMGTGTHVMSGTSTITHLPADSDSTTGQPKPWVCFGQIHDADGDVVRLQVEGSSTSSLSLKARTHSPNGSASTEVTTVIQSSYTIGDPIDWKIEVISGTCRIYIGGVVKKTITLSGSGGYFKAGDYQQFSTVSGDGAYVPSAYATTELKSLSVTHSPAL